MTSQHKELVEELNRHRLEVSKLRDALNALDREKEAWFRKKEDISSKIRDRIKRIKENKAKRDALTGEVKSLKPKRDLLNKDISSKLDELNKIKLESKELADSTDIKDPSRIKRQMEQLEFRIETEAIPFSKEKELMKKINQLRKAYGKASEIAEANQKNKIVSTGIRTERKEANDVHRQIQEKAKESQVLHEEIISISKEIEKLKAEEGETFIKFSEFRKKFHEANNELKEKMKLMNNSKGKLDKIYSDKKERRKQEEESFLKSKEEAVNEKIRKRQKLTTEDLLVFQKFGKE